LGNRPDFGARPSQLPSRTPQQRHDALQNRLATRDQIVDRSNIHDDWHDRYDDFYDRHDNWHHGNWNGNAGDWWHHMWDEHTALMAFGATMWGINRAAYGFGYWGYENPYYYETYPIGDDVVLDYSQPLEVETAPADAAPTDAAVPGMADFDAARAAFYKGDYVSALASTNKALVALPNDPIIHEFRALTLFAQGKYDEAAAGLHSVLAVGPGWDWTTLSSLYPDVSVYTTQLRALESAVKADPESQSKRFVLAYHYLTTGNKDAAINQLKQLYAKTPSDMVIKELLLMLGGPAAIGVDATAAETPTTPAAAIKAADLLGTWNAAGADGAKFVLLLNNEGLFSWTFTQDGKDQIVKGVYALDGNTLAMEPETGGVMLAEITPPQNGGFSFHMLGAPPGDAGLKFTKSR
jgi:tetratricopeptide (TPR) repeat protein